jgi:ADP-heptose:LPS heptosyltransferase
VSLKTWERRGKRGLTRAAARALRARGEAGALPDFRDLERILLIRQQNQLGDMLLSTPALRAVRARAPRARIDLISGPQNHDAVRGSRRLDEVILYDKAALLRRPLEARRLADRLRSARYDLALVLSTVSFSYTGAWLAAASGARRRAGRPGPGGAGRETAADVFHWCLPQPREDVHQTVANLDLVGPFGAAETDGTPEIFLADAESRRGRRALDDTLPAGRGLRILIHPGAGKKPNRWPAERFGEVGDALRAEGHAVAACSGPGEIGLLAAMDRAAGRPLARLPGIGFRELAAAFAGADLVLVNDTGVLHLAAASAPAVLALFGPTDPRLWCPATPRVRTLQAPGGDLRRLDVADVRTAAVAWAAARADGGKPPVSLRPAPELRA